MRHQNSPFYDEQKRFELAKAITPKIVELVGDGYEAMERIPKIIVAMTDNIIEELKKPKQ